MWVTHYFPNNNNNHLYLADKIKNTDVIWMFGFSRQDMVIIKIAFVYPIHIVYLVTVSLYGFTYYLIIYILHRATNYQPFGAWYYYDCMLFKALN